MTQRSTVLLIEDDHDVCEAFGVVLQAYGFDVQATTSGSEAMDRLAAGLHPGLIILDLTMPGMTAAEFRRAQLDEPGVRDVPVMVLSGSADIREQATELAAVGYLTKPVSVERLVAAVRRHCGWLRHDGD